MTGHNSASWTWQQGGQISLEFFPLACSYPHPTTSRIHQQDMEKTAKGVRKETQDVSVWHKAVMDLWRVPLAPGKGRGNSPHPVQYRHQKVSVVSVKCCVRSRDFLWITPAKKRKKKSATPPCTKKESVIRRHLNMYCVHSCFSPIQRH